MEKFAGSWKCVESENFDEFLKAVGVGFAIRQVVSRLKPTLTITLGGDGTVNIKLPQSDMTFKLGEEFEHTSADKRTTKNVITLNNGKLHHSQKWEDKEIIVEREVTGDRLVTTMKTWTGVEAVRTFVKES
ncbi:fatty acid-binding protein, heart-like isoform X2 [Engraulis encrasicolus]|uniref:fatty acid-binding protein, heart-like isoform X2 n=1 Tax=Engraulis encrasicolus TaxID=184585 RepID=UPI002FD4B3E9